jgi:hypothetical protein
MSADTGGRVFGVAAPCSLTLPCYRACCISVDGCLELHKKYKASDAVRSCAVHDAGETPVLCMRLPSYKGRLRTQLPFWASWVMYWNSLAASPSRTKITSCWMSETLVEPCLVPVLTWRGPKCHYGYRTARGKDLSWTGDLMPWSWFETFGYFFNVAGCHQMRCPSYTR